MTTFFVDTSALAKRYLTEKGSGWMRSICKISSSNIIVISELATVEMFSLFARREREQALTLSSGNRLRSLFLSHLKDEYIGVFVTTEVMADARYLVSKHPLRTLDAIQLACALRAEIVLNEKMTFLSADNRLLSAAAAEGLPTDNPNNYP